MPIPMPTWFLAMFRIGYTSIAQPRRVDLDHPTSPTPRGLFENSGYNYNTVCDHYGIWWHHIKSIWHWRHGGPSNRWPTSVMTTCTRLFCSWGLTGSYSMLFAFHVVGFARHSGSTARNIWNIWAKRSWMLIHVTLTRSFAMQVSVARPKRALSNPCHFSRMPWERWFQPLVNGQKYGDSSSSSRRAANFALVKNFFVHVLPSNDGVYSMMHYQTGPKSRPSLSLKECYGALLQARLSLRTLYRVNFYILERHPWPRCSILFSSSSWPSSRSLSFSRGVC